MKRWALAIGGALALAGCNRAPPGPEPGASPTPDAERPPVSIIRDDIEVEREAPPLAPLRARLGFPEGGAALSDESRAQLATVLGSPQMAAGGAIVLRGHTDTAGTDEANMRASRRRAEAVRNWLVEHGVDARRIEVIALGEQNPIEPNALPDGSPNEAGRAANRRVELAIALPAGTAAAKPARRPETLVDELSD